MSRRSHPVVLSGWGRVPTAEARELLSEDLAAITAGVPLSRGLGRSYGDASLPAAGDHRVAGSILADRILGFDPDSGILRAEAGFSVLNPLLQGLALAVGFMLLDVLGPAGPASFLYFKF